MIVPVGQRAISGRECVIWLAKFGKSRYGHILQEYEIQKTKIPKQISEYQSKLDDKACKLQEKEQELAQMTKNEDHVGRVAQPFRNHKIDFELPRITGKPPIFGVDKWIEVQNRSIADWRAACRCFIRRRRW